MPNYAFLSSFLEDTPQLAFQGTLANTGNKRVQNHFQNQFHNIDAQYQAVLGQQVLSGGLPSARYTDFVGRYPFLKEFNLLSPEARGESPRTAAPRIRFSG